MKKLVVLALGGNALLKAGETGTIQEQIHNADHTCKCILPLVKDDRFRLIITHGNGPQVGNILLQNETAQHLVPAMPLDACVADSEGNIGYILQQSMLNILRRHNIRRYVVTMITQVLVDIKDPSFKKPTKPIGPFFDKARADDLKTKNGWNMIEDSGRGYRRVVPSPRPIKIIQRLMIKDLVKAGHIVIAVGGGGIPIRKNRQEDYEGIEAVIDKDLASSLLARATKAHIFILLTSVPCVYLNYGKKNKQPIKQMSITQAKKYLVAGHFGTGSMAPKIEAAIHYLKKINGEVIITSGEMFQKALQHKAGTRIYSDIKKTEAEGDFLINF